MDKKAIVFTGGGTAGHIMPCIALIDELKNDYDIHYIGSKTGMEGKLVGEKEGVKFYDITTVKLRRSLSPKNLLIPFKLFMGRRQAKRLLKKIRPCVIFSKGGFVSLPVTLAAKRIPIICHESDMSLGIANRLVKRKAKYLCTSFKHTGEGLSNAICTGLPLRKSIYRGKVLNSGVKPRLLVMGGSLGSKALNNCIEGCINELVKRYEVTHVTGAGKGTSIKSAGYTQMEFVADIGSLYARADIVISRGGSTALFELVALKLKSLIIPLPKGISRGDQLENAEYFRARGLCHVLQEGELTPSSLLRAIQVCLDDKALGKRLVENEGVDGLGEVCRLIRNIGGLYTV